MDRANLLKISDIIDEMVGENWPTEDELNYDDDYIEIYQCLRNLKNALKNIGFC